MDKLKRVTFYLTQEQHAWLSKQALENKLSGKGADNASELIREAIELYRKAIEKESVEIHLTFKEWIKFTNYNYDENDHLTAEEDYADFCCKHSFWPIFD